MHFLLPSNILLSLLVCLFLLWVKQSSIKYCWWTIWINLLSRTHNELMIICIVFCIHEGLGLDTAQCCHAREVFNGGVCIWSWVSSPFSKSSFVCIICGTHRCKFLFCCCHEVNKSTSREFRCKMLPGFKSTLKECNKHWFQNQKMIQHWLNGRNSSWVLLGQAVKGGKLVDDFPAQIWSIQHILDQSKPPVSSDPSDTTWIQTPDYDTTAQSHLTPSSYHWIIVNHIRLQFLLSNLCFITFHCTSIVPSHFVSGSGYISLDSPDFTYCFESSESSYITPPIILLLILLFIVPDLPLFYSI